jgi:hypothetical protein
VRVPLQTQHRKYAERGFATPSSRVELYSQTFLDHGYAPLPEFEEPKIGRAAPPELAARLPLILTSAKSTLFCPSQHRALPSLRRRALILRWTCIRRQPRHAASKVATGYPSRPWKAAWPGPG